MNLRRHLFPILFLVSYAGLAAAPLAGKFSGQLAPELPANLVIPLHYSEWSEPEEKVAAWIKIKPCGHRQLDNCFLALLFGSVFLEEIGQTEGFSKLHHVLLHRKPLYITFS